MGRRTGISFAISAFLFQHSIIIQILHGAFPKSMGFTTVQCHEVSDPSKNFHLTLGSGWIWDIACCKDAHKCSTVFCFMWLCSMSKDPQMLFSAQPVWLSSSFLPWLLVKNGTPASSWAPSYWEILWLCIPLPQHTLGQVPVTAECPGAPGRPYLQCKVQTHGV